MEPIVQSTKYHCKFCFDTLIAKLSSKQLPKFPQNIPNIQAPIFVTWLYKKQLRGCIGTFSAASLGKILSKYALISALQDDRFDPISKQQLPHLSVCVSLLVNFRPNQGPYDWQIGKNGIILDLKRNGKHYNSTFLPEVAEQWQWDKKTTLKQLLQKAGFSGPLSLVQNDIKITTYETSKCEIDYNEWKQLSK